MIYAFGVFGVMIWLFMGCAASLRDSQDGQDACGPAPSMGEPVPDDEVAE